MPDTSLIGLTLANRFRISGVIGEGGMATVYRGAAPGQTEEVAIKIMNPDLAKEGRFVRRFRREAKAASMLKHPNTVKILEFGVDQGYVFLAMELLKGFDLAMLLHRERKIKEARAVQIVVQVCRALSAAHDQSIIHRDLKPDNIMLIPHPAGQPIAVAGLASTDFVKVLDFGIAKILDEDVDKPAVDSRAEPITQEKSMLTRVGTIVGTPAYMAPEQGRAEAVDARTDLYACGVLLYELITGRVPFTGETPMQVVMRHVNEPPRPPSDHTPVNPELEKLIMRALAKYASERQQSADEMANELLSVLPQLTVPAQDDMSAVKRTLVLDRAPSTNFGPPRPAAGAPAPRPAAGAPPPAASMGMASQGMSAASMSISGGSGASPFPTLNIEVPDDIFPDNFGAPPPASSAGAATRRIDPPAAPNRAPLPAPRPAAGMSAAATAAALAPTAPIPSPTPPPRHALDQTMQSEGSLPPPPPSEDEEEAATFIKAPTEENRSRMSQAEEQMAKALGAGLPSFSGPETVEPTLVAKGGSSAPAPAPAVRVQPHPQEKTVLTNPSPQVQPTPSVVVAALPAPPLPAATANLKNLQATMPLEPEQVEKAIQDAIAARPPASKAPVAAHASTVIVPESAMMPAAAPLPSVSAASGSSSPPRQRHPTSELIPVHLPEESSAAMKLQDLQGSPAPQPEAPLVWEPKGRKLSGATALAVGIAIGAIVVALAIGLIFLFGGNS